MSDHRLEPEPNDGDPEPTDLTGFIGEDELIITFGSDDDGVGA